MCSSDLELPGNAAPSSKMPVVAVLEDGKRRYYEVKDPVLLQGFEINANLPIGGVLGEAITMATRKISHFRLMNPKYWFNQLMREPFIATQVGRAGLITPFHSGKEFASLLFSRMTGADTDAMRIYNEMKGKGVTGSHDYLRDVIKEQSKLAAASGAKKRFDEAKDLFLSAHEYADAATKVAVMRKLVERAESGKLTGTPIHGEKARDAAIMYIGDMMNFSNKGKNDIIKGIMQVRPFFNSWVQGMDSLVRHATGYAMPPEEAKIARQLFWTHAMGLTAFSLGSAMLLCEFSEDFRDAPPDVWAGNWSMPMPEAMQDKKGRMFKAKGPFELNAVFRILPTMAARAFYGLDKGKDYSQIFVDQVWQDLAPPGLAKY